MALLGLFAYFFCLYIRPQDWVAAVYNWPIDYIVFGFVLLFGLMTKADKVGSVVKMPHFRIMAVWVTIVFLSNLIKGNWDATTENLYRYFRFLIIFFSFALVIDSFRMLKWFLLFMIALTFALALQGIYQYHHGYGWAGQPLGWLGRITWVGLWDGMNVLCLLYVISIPLIWQFLFGPWGKFWKIVMLAVTPYILYAIYLTNSRGGFMALMIVVFLNFRRRLASFSGVILGVLLFAAFITFKPSRFGDFNDSDDSAAYRIQMWQEAFEMVRYNPVMGIGKGQFINYTNKLIAHNSFLETMGETGMVGLLAWLSLLYISVRTLVQAKAALTDPQQLSLAEALLISILGYIATMTFVTCEFELMYVILALSMVVVRLSGVQVRFTMRDFRNVLLIQGGGIVVFWTMIQVFCHVYGMPQ